MSECQCSKTVTNFNIKVVENDERLMLQQTFPNDAGYDVKARAISEFCNKDEWEYFTLKPGERCLVKTGLFVELKEGWEIQVRPRSGLALKNQIFVLNTPGTIDAEYRGECCVILQNDGKEDFVINKYDRIAQFCFRMVPSVSFSIVDEINTTSRGEKGFGSSGK